MAISTINPAAHKSQPDTSTTGAQKKPPTASFLKRCTTMAMKTDPDLMHKILTTDSVWIDSRRWQSLKSAAMAIFFGAFYNRTGGQTERNDQANVSNFRLALLYIGVCCLASALNPFNKLDSDEKVSITNESLDYGSSDDFGTSSSECDETSSRVSQPRSTRVFQEKSEF